MILCWGWADIVAQPRFLLKKGDDVYQDIFQTQKEVELVIFGCFLVFFDIAYTVLLYDGEILFTEQT